jgi:hypothetical protein
LENIRNWKTVLILLSLLSLVVIARLATPSPVNACETSDDSTPVCVNWRAPLPPSPAVVATPTPRGDRPETARSITDTWSSIDPHASIWFKTDDSTGYREIELWVDTPSQGALGLSILSPDQMDSWWNAKPIGRGSYNPGEPGHALTWKAAYARDGIWYALLQNNSDAAVSYRVYANTAFTATKSCHGYWETLNGGPIYWIDCNPIHNPQ